MPILIPPSAPSAPSVQTTLTNAMNTVSTDMGFKGTVGLLNTPPRYPFQPQQESAVKVHNPEQSLYTLYKEKKEKAEQFFGKTLIDKYLQDIKTGININEASQELIRNRIGQSFPDSGNIPPLMTKYLDTYFGSNEDGIINLAQHIRKNPNDKQAEIALFTKLATFGNEEFPISSKAEYLLEPSPQAETPRPQDPPPISNWWKLWGGRGRKTARQNHSSRSRSRNRNRNGKKSRPRKLKQRSRKLKQRSRKHGS